MLDDHAIHDDDLREEGEGRDTVSSSYGDSAREVGVREVGVRPRSGHVPPRERSIGRQERRELDPANVARSGTPSNPNVPPGDLGIDLARLFEQASEQTRMAICVTDPTVPGNPIVHVNQAFTAQTGYPREEVVGRNCKFLQGPDTDPDDVAAIRAALDARQVRVIEILNYRRDGTPFWNSLHIGPIYDDAGKLTHFYGSQWDVTDAHDDREALARERRRSAVRRQVAEELQHRTNNLFAVLTAIVRLSARGATNASALADRVTERVNAMALAHAASIAPGGVAGAPADLGALAGAVLQPYRTGREGRIVLDGPEIVLPEAAVTPLGLALHELATNALKYGALSVNEGRVALRWERVGEGDGTRGRDGGERGASLLLTWTETGGPSPETDASEDGAGSGTGGTGTGSRLVHGVLRAVAGSIEQEWRETGLVATLRLPLGASAAS